MEDLEASEGNVFLIDMGTPVQMRWIAVVKINKEKEVQHVCPALKISITLTLSIGWFQKMKLKCLVITSNTPFTPTKHV